MVENTHWLNPESLSSINQQVPNPDDTDRKLSEMEKFTNVSRIERTLPQSIQEPPTTPAPSPNSQDKRKRKKRI